MPPFTSQRNIAAGAHVVALQQNLSRLESLNIALQTLHDRYPHSFGIIEVAASIHCLRCTKVTVQRVEDLVDENAAHVPAMNGWHRDLLDALMGVQEEKTKKAEELIDKLGRIMARC